MHGYLLHVVQGVSEVSQNGANVSDNLLVIDMGIYQTSDVEECGNIILCPLNCFYDDVNVLPVDLHGISGNIQY